MSIRIAHPQPVTMASNRTPHWLARIDNIRHCGSVKNVPSERWTCQVKCAYFVVYSNISYLARITFVEMIRMLRIGRGCSHGSA